MATTNETVDLGGWLDEIVAINFPTKNFVLTIECESGFFVANAGPSPIGMKSWNPSEEGITLTPNANISADPALATVLLNVVHGDRFNSNPGLEFDAETLAGNVGWAYPRPSAVGLDTNFGPPFFGNNVAFGIGFINLSFFQDKKGAVAFRGVLQLSIHADGSPNWYVRAALWKNKK